MAILKIRNENGEMEGIPAIQGDSGVYIGDGDMPDGYNIQIDTTSKDTSPILMYAPQSLTTSEQNTARNNIGAVGVDEVSNGLSANIPINIDVNHNTGSITGYGYIAYESKWHELNQVLTVLPDNLVLQRNDTRFVSDLSGVANRMEHLAPGNIYSLVIKGWCNIPFGIKAWDIWIDGIPREQWNQLQANKDGKTKRFDIEYYITPRPDVRAAVLENSGYQSAGFEIHTYFNNDVTPQGPEIHDIMLVALSNYGIWVPVGVIYQVQCFCNPQYQLITLENPVFPVDCLWGTQGKFFYKNDDGTRGDAVEFTTNESEHILPEYSPNNYWIQLY